MTSTAQATEPLTDTDVSRHGQRTSRARGVAVAVASLTAVAVAAWATVWSSGQVRLDLVVLATVVREVRSRWVRAVCLVVAGLAEVLLAGVSAASLAQAALLLGETFGLVWALRCWRSDRESSPVRRFTDAVLRLVLVVVVAASGEAILRLFLRQDSATFWSVLVRCLLPTAIAAALTAAIAGRSLLDGGSTPRSAKLAGPFTAIAIALIAVQGTLLYWSTEEAAALKDAAASTSASFQRLVATTLQEFTARAAAAPRTPVVDQASFDRSMRAYLYGTQAVSAVALVDATPDGFRVRFAADRAGGDSSLAPLLGGAWSDRKALDLALTSDATFILGVRDVPGADLSPASSVVWSAPWAIGTTAAPRQLLSTAIALPVLFSEAASTLDTTEDTVHLALVREPAGTLPASTSASIGPAAGVDAASAAKKVLLGDIGFQVVATPGEGFGTASAVRALLLAGLLALGLVAAALMLQAANARYRSRRFMEERESLLGAALEAASGTVLLVDHTSRVLMSNGGAAGRARVGRRVADVLPFPLHGAEGERVRRLLERNRHGETSTTDYVDTASGVSPVSYVVSVSPVASGTSGRATSVVRVDDVTEERARAGAAAQSERLRSLGTMAGGLAHDFNNLLFIISGYLQMLHDDDAVGEDADLSRYVERASDAAQRGTDIASSLLSVARSQPLEATAIEIASFLNRMWPLVEQAVGPGRHAVLGLGDGPLDVLVDSGQLSGSLLNLVINARDAMEPGGTVSVSVSRRRVDDPLLDVVPGDYVVVSVSDDGIGMTPEVVQRAFEPYFSTKGVGHGTGIGLATVYSFAQQSGGLAQIRSEREVGTTVTLYLPAVFAEHVPEGSIAVAEGSDGTRVLVVDDEAALAGLIAGWLTEHGAEVRVADNPALALRVAREFRPDVLLSDVRLGDPGGVDGPELADAAVAELPNLSVVFMTGFSDRMDDLLERGMHTLAKPFTRDALYRVLFPLDVPVGAADPGARDAR